MEDERRISLSDLWNQTPLPDEAAGVLERGGMWVVQWCPPINIVDWVPSSDLVLPEKTTVFRAIYKYAHLGRRDWQLLGKWADVDMQWAHLGQFSL